MKAETEKLIAALKALKPTSEFSIIGGEYSTIQWDVLDGDAPTEKQIADKIKELDKLESDRESQLIAQREAILDRLGLTAEEAALLLK